MLTEMPMTMVDRAPPARTIVMRLMSDRLARRLLTLDEAAPIVGYSADRLEDFVAEGSLPVVRLPSTSDEPTRFLRRIPVVWLPRLLQMQDRERPVLTARRDIGGQPGEPMVVSVATAAAAVGLTRQTAYLLIDKGRFAATICAPAGTMKISVDRLDDWTWSLVRDAECAWYGLDADERAVVNG